MVRLSAQVNQNETEQTDRREENRAEKMVGSLIKPNEIKSNGPCGLVFSCLQLIRENSMGIKNKCIHKISWFSDLGLIHHIKD